MKSYWTGQGEFQDKCLSMFAWPQYASELKYKADYSELPYGKYS